MLNPEDSITVALAMFTVKAEFTLGFKLKRAVIYIES
jgi:hypothetical protein